MQRILNQSTSEYNNLKHAAFQAVLNICTIMHVNVSISL